ncbi:MAG: RnfABCDGE type electron transport complex subunit D [Pseudomonadota bacterium]
MSEAKDKKDLLIVTSSPHVFGDDSVEKVMYNVVIALVPAILFSAFYFGIQALIVLLVAIAFSIGFEALFQKLFKMKIKCFDGSAIVTGILLAMNLPSNCPIWLVVLGAFIAIFLGKMVFGGLGNNPFNPALVARVFLLISFPVQMTSWPKPDPSKFWSVDSVTAATPLGILKSGNISEIMQIPFNEIFIGNVGGSLGEISALALLIGAAWLMYKRYISWHIPFSFIGATFIFTEVFYIIDPDKYASPVFHMFTGGLILGAFFMATDMVTSPISKKGKIIFGLGCGFITAIIRLWGGYPEGVSFAILIMNSVTPLIDKYTMPKRFGEEYNYEPK